MKYWPYIYYTAILLNMVVGLLCLLAENFSWAAVHFGVAWYMHWRPKSWE